jgi:two-component system phosphate regulon sensor histidine kinase PhoR
MRTPLSIITGEIELALAKRRSGEYYRSVLESTKEESEKLTHLVENLLFLAREDQKRIVNKYDTVDITDISLEVLASLQRKSQKKRLRVEIIPDKNPSFVLGNIALLRQLIFNLVDNAIAYTRDEGSISIKIKNKSQSVVFSVGDTGIGIPKADLEKIFDRFYRADSSRSQTKGYGLGLAIARSIVERHKGTISVRSKVGKGSTFTVTLPRIKKDNLFFIPSKSPFRNKKID